MAETAIARFMRNLRSYTLGPLKTSDPEIRKYFGGAPSSSGITVTEQSALTFSAVWAAVALIAGDVSALPLVLYRRNGQSTQRYDGHPLYRLLHDSPNPEMTSIVFRRTLQAHALTWGNGYAEIERDGFGRPRYLWPLTPDRVLPWRDGNVLRYRVRNSDGTDVVLDPEDMVHIPGLGWDGTQGYGVIDKARESVSMGLAAERFGATFYGNGSTFGGVITHPTSFKTVESRKNFTEALKTRHKGVDRAHNVLLLEDGMTFSAVGIPPDQAQFLESRQFQITEIARWFNVPPHKIGDLSRATFSNIEQQNIEYFQTTLVHWLVTWEQELNRKLVSPLERNTQFVQHVTEGLLRGDSQGRAALQSAEFNIGAATPNEIRALSNRNPTGGGDLAFVPMNMIPLDMARDYTQAQIDNLKAKAEQAKAPKANPAQAARIAELEAENRVIHEDHTRIALELQEEKQRHRESIDALSAANAGIEEARQALDAMRQELADVRRGGLEAAARHGELLADAHGKIEALTHERDVAVAGLDTALRDVEDGRATVAAITALLAGVRSERDTAVSQRDEAIHTVSVAEHAAALAAQERDEAREAKATADAEVAQQGTVVAGLNEQVAGLVADLEQALTNLEASRLDATTVAETARDATERAAAAEQARDEALVSMREHQTITAAAIADRDAAVLARTQAEQARQAAEQSLADWQERDRKKSAAVLVAHRGLVADVMQRLIDREVERARSRQGDRLKPWAETFYVTFEPAMADALTPSLRVCLAVQGSDEDPRIAAAVLAKAHCEASRQQIADLARQDALDLPLAVSAMLDRWERDRAGQTADAVLRKGLGVAS